MRKRFIKKRRRFAGIEREIFQCCSCGMEMSRIARTRKEWMRDKRKFRKAHEDCASPLWLLAEAAE